MRATVLYRGILNKAAGDHGGHVIGRTRTGKIIYASHHQRNRNIVSAIRKNPSSVTSQHALDAHPLYSADDHLDAAEAHVSHADQTTDRDQRKAAHLIAQAHASSSMAARSRARDKKLSPA